MSLSKTIIMSCAGTGSRLGLGRTKALLEIAGEPIIIHNLRQLDKFDDIRIVVGFDAKNLINAVLTYRKDITFVFNHDYLNSSTLQSLCLGARFSRDYIVSIDGDLLVAPKDLAAFLQEEREIMGYIETYSDEPVYTRIEKINGQKHITGFNRQSGIYEWTGLIQIKKDRIRDNGQYVYQTVTDLLPFPAKHVNCREIDTYRDYQKALKWAKEIF